MPRGIRIKGEAVRELRLARGWPQSLLAEHAGVSERTVRNAESGRVLGLHVAQCLAMALGVSVENLSSRHSPTVQHVDWEGLIRAFDTAYGQAILIGELDGLLEFTHSEIEWFCMTTPIMSFCGQFVGVDGLRSHCQAVHRFLRGLSVQARDPQYRMIHGVGNLLYFQGEVRFSTRHEEEQRYWVAKLLRFEENKIRSVEQFFGPLSPIGSLESTSHPASIARHGSQP